MSHTDYRRPSRRQRARTDASESFGRRQPRPNPRRQGTRAGIVAAAMREI